MAKIDDSYKLLRDNVSDFANSKDIYFSFDDKSLGSLYLEKRTFGGNRAIAIESISAAGTKGFDQLTRSSSGSNSGFAKKAVNLISEAANLPVLPASVINPRIKRIYEKLGYIPVSRISDEGNRYFTGDYTHPSLEYQRQDISQEGKQGFEYGQKFISPKSGESASLVTADMKGGAVLETLKGDRVQLTPEQYKKLNVKSPATLTDLKRGDGLILDNKASQFDGQRYTVMGSDADKVQLRSESGDIRLVPKSKIADNFRPNSLGFTTPASLRPVIGGFAGGTVGSMVFKQIAKAAGLNEDQQNAAAATGGIVGSFTGSALTNLRADTKLRLPTASEFAQTMMSAPQSRSAGARLFDLASSESGAIATSNKKINDGSISTTINEPNRPKLTSDIIADYLDRMGGQATLVKPDGSQYNPDRKGRVNVGDRMTLAEKFGQAGDVGLNNEFQKLPEVHARFDDRMTALQVQKEIATGRLTTQKFFEVPTKEIANQAADEIRRSPELLGRGETLEVRPSKGGFEVVAVKAYQPIPSRGNTLARTYNLNNDATGTFVAFNKPEESYSAPKSLKELQADTRKAYQTFGLKPNASIADLEAAVQPIVGDVKTNPQLRDRLSTVLSDIQSRTTPEPVIAERGWDKVPARSPMTEQLTEQFKAIAPAPPQSPPLPPQSPLSKTRLALESDRIGGYEPKHVPKILEALNNEDTYRAVLGSMNVGDQERFNSALEALDEGNKFGNRDLLATLNKARRDVPTLGGDRYLQDARQGFSDLDDALGVKFGFNKTLKFGLNEFKNSAAKTYRVDIPDQAKIELSQIKVDGKSAFRVDNIVAYNPEAVGDRFAMKTLKFLQENLPKPVVMGNVINEKFGRIFEKQGYVKQGNDYLPPELVSGKQAIDQRRSPMSFPSTLQQRAIEDAETARAARSLLSPSQKEMAAIDQRISIQEDMIRSYQTPSEQQRVGERYAQAEIDRRSSVLEDLKSQRKVIAPEPQQLLNTARDTGGWANAVGEPYAPPRSNSGIVDIRQPRFAAEMGLDINPTGLSDRGAYNRIKASYEADNFGLGDRLKPFPDFYDLQRQSKVEGVRPEAFQNYIKGKAEAPLIESGIMNKPELPKTARLGQEYISPKTGNVGTVSAVGRTGVKMVDADGQPILVKGASRPDVIEYKTLEKLKYTGNKAYGFTTFPVLNATTGATALGLTGYALAKSLAKQAGLNEDQQNAIALAGGAVGSVTGGAIGLVPTALSGELSAEQMRLKTPDFKKIATSLYLENMRPSRTASTLASPETGAIFSASDRANILANKLPQYDVKPVLGEAAVIATDLLTPHPYGIATVPAARMATDSWKNNYDAIAERGLSGMKSSAMGATSAVKDFTYQTLSQLGRSVGLPFPTAEQSVGQVLDAIPNSQQMAAMADRAKTRLARQFGLVNTEAGAIYSAGDMNPRQSTGAIFEVEPKSLNELQKQRAKLDTYNPDAKPIQAVKEFKPVPKLSLEESAAMQGMKPNEYKGFQEKVYQETDFLNSKPYQEASERIAQQQFKQQQTYFDAMKAWNKANDPTIPMPRKEDFAQPMKRTFDIQSTLSEASLRAKQSTARSSEPVGFGKTKPKSAIAQATQAIQNVGEMALDAIYQPSRANPSRVSSPKQSNFIAESAVEAAAKSSGATTAQVKAQIANQRSTGQAPDLNLATDAIAQTKQTKELTTRSLKELQSKELSTKVSSRQLPDGMIATPSESMIKAGLKEQNRIKIGDRIGASGIGIFMDTAQAAQVLTESASRGEKAPVALTRAGLSVGAGYGATALASLVPNTYARTALQIGGGIAAVIGADKLVDQVVGRDEAKEQKYAKDLSKLDLQATNEQEQWKPFANDSNLAAAYGNSLTAQVQQNLDYRPAARSLANLTNSQSIENARYASERDASIKTGVEAKSKRSIAYEDRGNGVTAAYGRDRGYTSTESRVLALQNLANESGYSVDRTGKFNAKTLDALEKLGYSQSQITNYIQGKSGEAIGKPESKPVSLVRSKSKFGGYSAPVQGSELSAALSAERKAQGLKGGEMLNQSQVDNVFSSLAGRSLTQLRQSAKVGGNKTQSAIRLGAGISK
jgi:hypothetical protein